MQHVLGATYNVKTEFDLFVVLSILQYIFFKLKGDKQELRVVLIIQFPRFHTA